jgi:hypothetical protein
MDLEGVMAALVRLSDCRGSHRYEQGIHDHLGRGGGIARENRNTKSAGEDTRASVAYDSSGGCRR